MSFMGRDSYKYYLPFISTSFYSSYFMSRRSFPKTSFMQGLLLKIKYNGTRKHIFLVLFYNSFNVYSKVVPNLRQLMNQNTDMIVKFTNKRWNFYFKTQKTLPVKKCCMSLLLEVCGLFEDQVGFQISYQQVYNRAWFPPKET